MASAIKQIEPAPYLKNQTNETLQFAIHEYKMGRTEETVKGRIRTLNRIAKTADLNNPDSVLTALTTISWKNSTKNTFLDTYSSYLKFKGIKWTRPKIQKEETLPFIPTETELDQLITASQIKMATMLQLLKETGMRISEIVKLKWKDLDTERKTLNITPSKGSSPRILPLSNKLIGMLNKLKRTKETIFAKNKGNIRNRFCLLRKRIAETQQNPRIKQISFHTFRHWKGTIEYHKTKDIVHVKYILGHKAITSTMRYINLENGLFRTETDEYYSATATTIEEAKKLIETGFEYITEIEGTKLFRKRK